MFRLVLKPAQDRGEWRLCGLFRRQALILCEAVKTVGGVSSHQYSFTSAGHSGSVSDVKPHATTACALPGSPQSLAVSLQAAAQQNSAKAVLSHGLDFSAHADIGGDVCR